MINKFFKIFLFILAKIDAYIKSTKKSNSTSNLFLANQNSKLIKKAIEIKNSNIQNTPSFDEQIKNQLLLRIKTKLFIISF